MINVNFRSIILEGSEGHKKLTMYVGCVFSFCGVGCVHSFYKSWTLWNTVYSVVHEKKIILSTDSFLSRGQAFGRDYDIMAMQHEVNQNSRTREDPRCGEKCMEKDSSWQKRLRGSFFFSFCHCQRNISHMGLDKCVEFGLSLGKMSTRLHVMQSSSKNISTLWLWKTIHGSFDKCAFPLVSRVNKVN